MGGYLRDTALIFFPKILFWYCSSYPEWAHWNSDFAFYHPPLPIPFLSRTYSIPFYDFYDSDMFQCFLLIIVIVRVIRFREMQITTLSAVQSAKAILLLSLPIDIILSAQASQLLLLKISFSFTLLGPYAKFHYLLLSLLSICHIHYVTVSQIPLLTTATSFPTFPIHFLPSVSIDSSPPSSTTAPSHSYSSLSFLSQK